MSSVPTSVPQPGLGAKLNALWMTNKPVFIAIIVGLVLLVFGIIFLILWFTVIKPHQNSSSTPAAATAKAAHMVFESGRHIRNLWQAI